MRSIFKWLGLVIWLAFGTLCHGRDVLYVGKFKGDGSGLTNVAGTATNVQLSAWQIVSGFQGHLWVTNSLTGTLLDLDATNGTLTISNLLVNDGSGQTATLGGDGNGNYFFGQGNMGFGLLGSVFHGTNVIRDAFGQYALEIDVLNSFGSGATYLRDGGGVARMQFNRIISVLPSTTTGITVFNDVHGSPLFSFDDNATTNTTDFHNQGDFYAEGALEIELAPVDPLDGVRLLDLQATNAALLQFVATNVASYANLPKGFLTNAIANAFTTNALANASVDQFGVLFFGNSSVRMGATLQMSNSPIVMGVDPASSPSIGLQGGNQEFLFNAVWQGNVASVQNNNPGGYAAFRFMNTNSVIERGAIGFVNANSFDNTNGFMFLGEFSTISNGVDLAPLPGVLYMQTGPVYGIDGQHKRMWTMPNGELYYCNATNMSVYPPLPGNSNLLMSFNGTNATITGYGMAGTNGVLNLASGSNGIVGISISNGVPYLNSPIITSTNGLQIKADDGTTVLYLKAHLDGTLYTKTTP